MLVIMSDTVPSYRTAPPRLVAGRLCLDFVNTVEWRGAPGQRLERLTDYGELLLWSAAAGLLDDADCRLRSEEAARRPSAATSVVRQAVAARELLAGLLAGDAGLRGLADFNWLLRQMPRGGLRADGKGHTWRFDGGDRLGDPLWPVLWDAAALLASPDLDRVSHCRNARCGWFFLDHSRNRSRRWCSMDSCGNRAKARRHYARHKAAAEVRRTGG